MTHSKTTSPSVNPTSCARVTAGGESGHVVAKPDDPDIVFGGSYGGYLTTLDVSRNSDIFHVAWDMAGNAGNAAVANLASWTAPTLIEQGDDDRNVNFSSNVSVVRAIKTQKPSLELATRVFPNEQHELYMRFEDLVDSVLAGSVERVEGFRPTHGETPFELWHGLRDRRLGKCCSGGRSGTCTHSSDKFAAFHSSLPSSPPNR